MTATSPASTTADRAQVDYALEIRSEVLRIISGDDAKHRGDSEQIEIGSGGANDQVTGDETLDVGGTLSEHVSHSSQARASGFETHIQGRMDLTVHSDMTLLGGAMTETWAGAVLTLSGMSDNMVAGIGTRISTLDLWLIGLTGMEEKIATAAADLAFVELYVNHMEREYTSGSHLAGTAYFSGAVFTTMATGFRQLVKVAAGIRDLSSGGEGGGGGGPEGGSSTPPPVPPAGNPGMLDDVDNTEDLRRAGDTTSSDTSRRRVRFSDDVVDMDTDSVLRADVSDGGEDLEDVRRADDIGDVEGDEGTLRGVDSDEPPPEVPERTEGYHEKILETERERFARDKRKQTRIELARELQAMEEGLDEQGLNKYQRLQVMEAKLKDMLKNTDASDTVRRAELERLIENSQDRQRYLARLGWDRSPPVPTVSRGEKLDIVRDVADDPVYENVATIYDDVVYRPRDPDAGDRTPGIRSGYEFPDDMPPPVGPRDPDMVDGTPGVRSGYEFPDDMPPPVGPRDPDMVDGTPGVRSGYEFPDDMPPPVGPRDPDMVDGTPPVRSGYEDPDDVVPPPVGPRDPDMVGDRRPPVRSGYEDPDDVVPPPVGPRDPDMGDRRPPVRSGYEDPDDVVPPGRRREGPYDFIGDESEILPPPTGPRDPDMGSPSPNLPPGNRDPLADLPIPPPPRPEPQTLSTEEFRKLYGIPDDFDLQDEWAKLNERYSSSRVKSKLGTPGDPNNPRVMQALAEGRDQLQDLANAYYDEVLPPDARLLMGRDLGPNPKPDQVRDLIAELLEEQRRMVSTWVSDDTTTDLQHLEDLLNSYDAASYRILKDTTETADAYAAYPWKKLPEGIDKTKLLNAINDKAEAAFRKFGTAVTDEDLQSAGPRFEYLDNLRKGVEQGLDPTEALTMAEDFIKKSIAKDPENAANPSSYIKLGVLEEVRAYWEDLLRRSDPDFDMEEYLWQFEKNALWQRNSGDQGTYAWHLGTNTEAATEITQTFNRQHDWSLDFIDKYNIPVTKHEYGDQTDKVRKWINDHYAKISDRGTDLAGLEAVTATKEAPDKRFIDIRRSILDAIEAAEGDPTRVEELRQALEEFDSEMFAAISAAKRKSEAALLKPTVPLDTRIDPELLLAKLDELNERIAEAIASEQMRMQELIEAGKDSRPAELGMQKQAQKLSGINRVRTAIENGQDPLPHILDAMARPKYQAAHQTDALVPRYVAEVEGLQELYDSVARILRDPDVRKPQSVIGDQIAGLLRNLPQRPERRILPGDAVSVGDVHRALEPLGGDLTELENWEVIWYRSQIIENTRQAEAQNWHELFTYGSRKERTAAAVEEYRNLSKLYDEEYLRRFGLTEHLEEVYRKTYTDPAPYSAHDLDPVATPYVQRFIGESGAPFPADVDLEKFKSAFEPFVGRNAELEELMSPYWSMRSKRTWHDSINHGWTTSLDKWSRFVYEGNLGSRPAAYDVVADLEVVLESVRYQARRGIDPNAVIDSYLNAGRRLYFDDDMLAISDSVAGVLREAVIKIMPSTASPPPPQSFRTVSRFRTIDSLGPHIFQFLASSLRAGYKVGIWELSLNMLRGGNGQPAPSSSTPAGNPGPGNAGGAPDMFADGSWRPKIDAYGVRWDEPDGVDNSSSDEFAVSGVDFEDDDNEDGESEIPAQRSGRRRERTYLRQGRPWDVPAEGEEETETASGRVDATEVADAAYAGIFFYTGTTPAVRNAHSGEAMPLTAGGDAADGQTDGYTKRRDLIGNELGDDPDYARPPSQCPPGFGDDASKSRITADESGSAANNANAGDTAIETEVGDVLYGASTRPLAERSAAQAGRLLLDARESRNRGFRFASDVSPPSFPGSAADLADFRGFSGRRRILPWGKPWNSA